MSGQLTFYCSAYTQDGEERVDFQADMDQGSFKWSMERQQVIDSLEVVKEQLARFVEGKALNLEPGEHIVHPSVVSNREGKDGT